MLEDGTKHKEVMGNRGPRPGNTSFRKKDLGADDAELGMDVF